MPVPGRPRNAGGNETRFRSSGQDGVAPTKRFVSGPRGRFHERQHTFVTQLGRSPGVQHFELSLDTTAPGQIRRLWRQAIDYIGAGPPVSWTENGIRRRPLQVDGQITRALRYKASSLFRGTGSSNTRFGAPRPIVQHRHNQPRVTRGAGNLAARPTLRNRLTSFGSRVPPTNRGGGGV